MTTAMSSLELKFNRKTSYAWSTFIPIEVVTVLHDEVIPRDTSFFFVPNT